MQNEVPSAIILNSIDITLETRALARLAGHKFIIDEVQNFRRKYSDWKLCITDLLSDLGAKYKAKKKPNKNKSVKTEVKTKILNKNKSIKNMDKFENVKSESDDQSVSGGAQSEPEYQSVSDYAQSEHEDQSVSDFALSGHEDQSVSDCAQSEHEDQSVSEKPQPESEKALKNDSSLVQKMLPHENNTCSNEYQNNESKGSKLLISNNKEMSVRNKEECLSTLDSVQYSQVKTKFLNKQLVESTSHLSTNEILDNDVNLNKNIPKRKSRQSIASKIDIKKKKVTVNEIKPVCETVDSFFMTVDNKDYMSVYKPPPAIERNIEERTKEEYHKPIKEFFSKGKKVIIGKQNNIGNRRERRQQQVEESVDTALHPSWEAKRKQKSLAKFEGKKITFENDD